LITRINRARNTFIEVDGVVAAAPAPRFSRTVPQPPQPPRASGVDLEGTLWTLGLSCRRNRRAARFRGGSLGLALARRDRQQIYRTIVQFMVRI